MSQRQIGDVLGVHHDTVRRDLKDDAGNTAQTNGEKPDCAANTAKTEEQEAEEFRQRFVAENESRSRENRGKCDERQRVLRTICERGTLVGSLVGSRS